ncbi:MAG: 4-hydroxy-tetrahydrodipicolinate reductase [Myxococcales bacterium]|nr:4-hydroxy-tetrahydrodipicolinate reductase [Myxococcales bacterium]|tara:strand:- start:2792 stop:3604 length:813 start_codon:yes stop_codon:yes gene_type:complete
MHETGIIVAGIKGRMGHLIAQEAAHHEALAAGTVRMGDASDGKSLLEIGMGNFGDGPVSSNLEGILTSLKEEHPNRQYVMIDFTSPEAMLPHLGFAATHQIPMLVGTTPMNEELNSAIDHAAKNIPIIYAANTSLGANLQHWITAKVAKALPTADVEIMEIHHKRKKDAPSGTATWLADGIMEASERGPMVLDRATHGLRKPKEVGVTALRGGDVPGEHTAYFFLHDERIEISHKAQSRTIFAQGAVAAAFFLSGQVPGRYSMNDVLGLS